MKYLLFTMSAIIIAASCSNNITDHRNTVRIDSNQFEFELPKESKALDEDFKKVMLQQNNNILYIAKCDTNDAKSLFMVSKYFAENKMSIEEAFTQSVKTTTNFSTDSLADDFQLIDYKTHEVQGVTIRYKISKHFDNIYDIYDNVLFHERRLFKRAL